MANELLIEKQTGGYFKFTLNSDAANAITSIQNDLLAVGNQLHFKTGNGANIIKEQFIYPEDVTLVASGVFTFTTVAQVWDKLIEVGYFAWLSGTSGGVDRFDDLLDTFQYTGSAGKAVIVDNSETKLVPITLYNKRLFTELEDTPSSLVPNKMLVVNPAGTAVVLQDQPFETEQFLNSVGYFDYNDLATQTTPLTVVANVAKKLTNDTEGANTSTDQNPYGVSYVWDYTTNQFNFSELEVGDTIDVRIHVQVTTTTSNQKVSMSAKFGIGSVSEFTNSIYENMFKSSGTHEVSFVAPFYMGSTYITDYPAELYLTSDASATVKVDGWYIRILRKNINIVTVDYQVPDATTSVKGIVRLAGDLGGTANNPTVPELANKVPTSRTLTINGTGYDLSSNRSWDITAGVWGQITGTLSSQTDLQTALNAKANASNVVDLSSNQVIQGLKEFNVVRPVLGMNLSLRVSDISTSGEDNGMLRMIDNTTFNELFVVESDGTVFGKSFIKKDGTSSQYLMADGSVSAGGGTISGTTNYIPKFTGSTAIGNSLIYDNGTNVGIGTTSPAAKLDVHSVIRATNTSSAAFKNAALELFTYNGSSVSAGTSLFSTNSNFNYGTIISNQTNLYGVRDGGIRIATGVAPIVFSNGNSDIDFASERMRITSSGNVGIGTTSPYTLLDVNGSVGIANITVPTDASGDSKRAGIGWKASGATTTLSALITTNNVGDWGGDLTFYTRPAGSGAIPERMRIASNGAITVGSTITASGGFFNSDMRLKELTDYDYNVSEIKPISYFWKDGRDNKKHVGYSAQEVQKVMPDAVNEGADGFLSVNYVEVLVAQVSFLTKRIEELEKIVSK